MPCGTIGGIATCASWSQSRQRVLFFMALYFWFGGSRVGVSVDIPGLAIRLDGRLDLFRPGVDNVSLCRIHDVA